MQRRWGYLRTFMEQQGLDAILVAKPVNRRYFSGFTGSAGLLYLTFESASLITDFRYLEQAAAETTGVEIVRQTNSLYETVAKQVTGAVNTIGFEADFISVEAYGLLQTALAANTLKPIQLDALRAQKDQQELALIRQAVAIADAAFSHIVDTICIGMSEQEVAFSLETFMRQHGSSRPAFTTIVASGSRGALPHGIASDKLLAAGDFVTMDFGAVYQGYHSDLTRTIVMGTPTEQQQQIYQIVLAAQHAGIDAVKPGLCGCEIDAKARAVIDDAGYGEYFGHGLGHSVGLAIHEEPRLSPANTTVSLAEQMVVTVEPGIYIPGWGGVRIEDMVVVTATGCDILTKSPKRLIEINR